MNQTRGDALVAEYLDRVRAAASGLGPGRREELIQDLREHIATARAELTTETEEGIRAILDRLGDPAAIAAEAAVAVGFVGWATWDTLTALAAQNDPTRALIPGTETTGVEPFYALGIAAASLAITVAALALFHRRIVREGTSQA